MELIAPLSEGDLVTQSYPLFQAVTQKPVSPIWAEDKKWQTARLAMHGAYKWVHNPQDILTFLDYHFELATKYGEDQDEPKPTQVALRALAYASSDVTIEA